LWAACLQATSRDTPALLDEAVRRFRESLDRTPPGAPLRARHLHNLGQALADRARRRGDPGDRAAALDTLRRAWHAGLARDLTASVSAGRAWGDLGGDSGQWQQAVEGYLRSLAAVSMLVSGQHHRRGKEGWLREAQQVPAAAAGALARLGLHADAVRVLEAGRAVLLAERLLQPPGAPADGA
jgi:hypothetical protein